MPKQSYRRKALTHFTRNYERAKLLFAVDQLLDGDDDSSLDFESPSFLSYLRARSGVASILDSRYISKRTCRKSSMNIFENDLHEQEDGLQWMNDSDFKKKYRMSRDMLDQVTDLIKDNDVFKRGKRGPKQMKVKHQLMVWLNFVGKEGESNGSQRNTFKISEGACEKCRERVVKAFVSMCDEYITWPDEEERKEIADRIEAEFKFPNCIGLMDGTLVELAITPLSDDAADYNGRKYGYSLTIMVINDDRRKIRAYLSGFPGSTHDNRVWKAMDQCQNSDKYFSPLQYILTDTAFEPSNHAIPAYKSQTGFIQEPNKELFNTALATPRVISEHVMGMWKGRCGWLRKIRMLITNNPKSLTRILRYIEATIVLHNMLIDLGEEMEEDDEWNGNDDLSDVDDPGSIPEAYVLGLPIPGGAPKDTRREQLKDFIVETYVPSYNFQPIPEDILGEEIFVNDVQF